MRRYSSYYDCGAVDSNILFSVTVANAAVYKFTFQSNDAELTATGEITVDAGPSR